MSVETPKPYVCPAALSLKGRHYPCETMGMMEPGSQSHDGWSHSNKDAEAVWTSDRDPVPGMPGARLYIEPRTLVDRSQPPPDRVEDDEARQERESRGWTHG